MIDNISKTQPVTLYVLIHQPDNDWNYQAELIGVHDTYEEAEKRAAVFNLNHIEIWPLELNKEYKYGELAVNVRRVP